MTRIKLAVYVDLDPTPGVFHTAESAANYVRNILNISVGHYNPVVSIEEDDTHADEIRDAIEGHP